MIKVEYYIEGLLLKTFSLTKNYVNSMKMDILRSFMDLSIKFNKLKIIILFNSTKSFSLMKVFLNFQVDPTNYLLGVLI